MTVRSIVRHILSIIFICLWTYPVYGQSLPGSSVGDFAEDVYMDMELENNIATPVVPKKAEGDLRKYIRGIAEELNTRYTVDLMRENEVFIISIPTDDLFAPNDTLLSDAGRPILNNLLPLMQDPMMYKIVMAVHTDDTGSKNYLLDLSTARLNSIYDWVLDAIENGSLSQDLIVIPYAMGGEAPVTDNDSREHRRENRRLEVYFIPGPKLIDMALKGQLK